MSIGEKARIAAHTAEWVAKQERGSPRMLRLMAYVSLRLGRRVSRVPLYLIALYFFLFAPGARRHSRRYLGLVLGRPPTAAERYRHLLYFSTTIHDRVFLINERDAQFEISIEGTALMEAQLASGHGAFLMGSHMGSFEVVSTVGRRQPGLHVVMTMYEANARKINAILNAINPGAKADVIPLGRVDSMLNISERLERGSFVGVLGDRTLGDEPMQDVTVLGVRTRLPTGPMRTAAILGRSVIFMAGLYRGGNRYHVVFAPLADFSQTPAGTRAAAVAAAVDRYALLLDQYCRSDPYNWFNFFDFWPAESGKQGK
jgi:predicted LPLAT superfamily acyltransferase